MGGQGILITSRLFAAILFLDVFLYVNKDCAVGFIRLRWTLGKWLKVKVTAIAVVLPSIG